MKPADKDKLKSDMGKAKGKPAAIMDFFSPKVKAKGKDKSQVNLKRDQ